MAERLQMVLLQIGADVLPILVVVLVFQAGIIRRKPAHLRHILVGGGYMLLGLALFRLGLEDTLLPLGGLMADQLVHLDGAPAQTDWRQQLWLVLFAGAIGLAATLIEPALMAIGKQVQELTGGGLRAGALRVVVALGMAAGLMLGTLRLITGIPLLMVIAPLLVVTGLLCRLAPRSIVPLALDVGPMATSVVTVPLIAVFGVTVATSLPGRDPLMDGFGLVFFALLTPVISLLAFSWLQRRHLNKRAVKE